MDRKNPKLYQFIRKVMLKVNTIPNYRPISLLPITSKVYEKIDKNQLLEYLEGSKLLSDTQHGFRPGK